MPADLSACHPPPDPGPAWLRNTQSSHQLSCKQWPRDSVRAKWGRGRGGRSGGAQGPRSRRTPAGRTPRGAPSCWHGGDSDADAAEEGWQGSRAVRTVAGASLAHWPVPLCSGGSRGSSVAWSSGVSGSSGVGGSSVGSASPHWHPPGTCVAVGRGSTPHPLDLTSSAAWTPAGHPLGPGVGIGKGEVVGAQLNRRGHHRSGACNSSRCGRRSSLRRAGHAQHTR